jgi:hypothetical protein
MRRNSADLLPSASGYPENTYFFQELTRLRTEHAKLWEKFNKLKYQVDNLLAAPSTPNAPSPKPRHRIKLTVAYRGKYGSVTYDYVTKDWTGSISINGIESYSTHSTIDPVIQDLEEYVDKVLDKS